MDATDAQYYGKMSLPSGLFYPFPGYSPAYHNCFPAFSCHSRRKNIRLLCFPGYFLHVPCIHGALSYYNSFPCFVLHPFNYLSASRHFTFYFGAVLYTIIAIIVNKIFGNHTDNNGFIFPFVANTVENCINKM